MIKLGVVMDSLSHIKLNKDSTLAMLESAQAHGFENYFFQQPDIFVRDGQAQASMQRITLNLNATPWYELAKPSIQPLNKLDVILMRKDPPFDMEYIYTTYLLELAEKSGTLVINKPQSLRDANEKAFTSLFPQCTPESLITCSAERIHEFVAIHHDVILKPLNAMGGHSIFRVQQHDLNLNVIIETLTVQQTRYAMVQRFIPEIVQGDKRIILINGAPIEYALTRIPQAGDFRGNIAAGASAKVVELTARDRWICQQVAPTLREKGLAFVGLDVIGDYLTEINVTSPTGIREIEKASNAKIADKFIEYIATALKNRSSSSNQMHLL